jgi:hypothetical protein
MPDLHSHRFWKFKAWEELDFVIFKSHFKEEKCEGRKVVYLYRDGRDTALSCYYYYNHEGTDKIFSKYLVEDFISGKMRFGGWKTHVERWLQKTFIGIYFLKYEELYSETFSHLKNIVSFFQIETTDEIIQQAIEKSELSKMRKIGAAEGYHPKLVGLSGKPGGWKEKFSMEDLKNFWNYAGDLMENLGYCK